MRQLLPLLLCLGCGRDDVTPPRDDVRDDSAPPEGCDGLTWSHDGLPEMLTWCAACHSSLIQPEDRAGAPIGVDLESVAGVRAHLDRVILRIEAGDMPPAGGVPEAKRARLLQWLRCGAPGDELVWPTTTPAEAPEESWDQEEAVVAGDEAEQVEDRGRAPRLDRRPRLHRGLDRHPRLKHRWSRVRSGTPPAPGVSRISFEPPLTLWRADQTDWSILVLSGSQRMRQASQALEEEWTVSLGPALSVDPRSLAPNPEAIIALVQRRRAPGASPRRPRPAHPSRLFRPLRRRG
jgi:hypothetical protein